jgi:putative phage-type endonuclease
MSTGTLIQIDTKREEWLEQRRLGLGGSDAAAIFNEGWGCARALYFDKTDTPPDFQRTEREESILRRGTLMEELVAEEYSYITGRKIRRMGTRVSKKYPWMRVNIDRQLLGDSRGPGVLEVKTANPWVYRDMKAPDPETGLPKGLPTQYVLQMQHAFAVTGYTWGAFAVMNASTWEMLPFDVEPNYVLIDALIEAERNFWNAVQERRIPDPLPKANDKRCANCQWRKTCRGQVVIVPDDESEYVEDESLAELAADLKEAWEIAEEKTALAEHIEGLLKEAVGQRTHIKIPSVGCRIRWAQQKGRSGWDARALTSLCEQLRRIDGSTLAEFVVLATPEQKALLEELVPNIGRVIAAQLENCKKVGSPTRPWYFEPIER